VAESTHFRTCPFCEATCGLEVTLEDQDVTSVRGDADDVFSRGFLCPKGTGVKHLQEDPDRLCTPLVKQADGSFAEVSWEEALKVVDERLSPILTEHGRDAVAVPREGWAVLALDVEPRGAHVVDGA